MAFLAEVVTVLRILITSSWNWAEEAGSVAGAVSVPSVGIVGTSKNSVSPALRWIVSQTVREGRQVPSP